MIEDFNEGSQISSRKSITKRSRRDSPRKLNIWQRLALGVFLAPFVLTGAAGAAYYYNLHQYCASMTLDNLPIAPPATADRRLLVLSPHCDDETLGVGGQIAEARKAGVPVTVAFLTNGDGFRIAASRSLHKVDVTAGDFVRFAEMRQQESIAALSELGVKSRDIQFLGYPDRGLRPMWESNWDRSNPFLSGFTDSDRSPYDRTYTRDAPYAGQQLVDDLVRLMESTEPTDILVTHPADDHPDHSAAASFTEEAFRVCRSHGDRWAARAHMHYYVVHRGDWPLPQGSHPDLAMLPPPGLVTDDVQWTVCPLTAEAQAAKARALARYGSQTGVSGRFLSSFVRTNELRIDLPVPETKSGAVVATGVNSPAGAPAVGNIGVAETAAANLYGDNLARYVEPAGDITDLSVKQSNTTLYIRLQTRTAPSPMIHYVVRIRACETLPNGNDQTRCEEVSVDATSGTSAAGPTARELLAVIPLSRLGFLGPGHDRCIWVSGESCWTNRLPVIDWTGYREFRLDSPANKVRKLQAGIRLALPSHAAVASTGKGRSTPHGRDIIAQF